MSISETNSKRDRKKNKYDAFNMSISWKEAFYGEDWKEKGIKPKGNAPSIRILPLVEVVFNDKLKMRVISNISKKKTVTKINTVDKLMDAMDDALSSSTLQQIRKEMNEKLNMKNYKENVLEKLKVFDKKNKNVVVFGELKAWKTFFKQRTGHLFKQISVGLTTKFKNDGFGKLAAIESVNEPKKKKRAKRSLHRISGNASVCVFFLFFFSFCSEQKSAIAPSPLPSPIPSPSPSPLPSPAPSAPSNETTIQTIKRLAADAERKKKKVPVPGFDHGTYHDVHDVLVLEILEWLRNHKTVAETTRHVNEILLKNNNEYKCVMDVYKLQVAEQNQLRTKLEWKDIELNELCEQFAIVRAELYNKNRTVQRLQSKIKEAKSRTLAPKRKDIVKASTQRWRARQAKRLLDEYFNEAERHQMLRMEVLCDEYDFFEKLKKKWGDQQNQYFREMEKNPSRILRIALTEFALGVNHRQAHESRSVNCKIMGERGQRIIQKTKDGVRFGGGLISLNSKVNALRSYETKRIDLGIGFVPIERNTLKIDVDYERFGVMSDGADDIEAKDADKRFLKRGKDKPHYIAAKVDLSVLFALRLKQCVLSDKCAAWKYNKVHFDQLDGSSFDVLLVLVGSFDGYQAVGHFISTKRTLHNLKFSGFQRGVAGGTNILFRVLQVLAGEDENSCFILRDKWFYDEIEMKILSKVHSVQWLAPNGELKQINFKVLFAVTGDLMGLKRDIGTKGPNCKFPQIDVVIFEPVKNEMTFIPMAGDDLSVANLPMYYPHMIEADRDAGTAGVREKHLRFLKTVPEYKQRVRSNIQILDDEKTTFVAKEEYDPKDKSIKKRHTKRSARLNDHKYMSERGGQCSPVIYEPKWLAINNYSIDVLHYNTASGIKIIKYLGRKLNDWKLKDVHMQLLDQIEDDWSIKACLANQYRKMVEKKDYNLSLTNMQTTKVIKLYYKFLMCVVEALKKKSRIFVCAVLINLLNCTQKLRRINEKYEYVGGLENDLFVSYQGISKRKYKMIIQLMPDFVYPYEFINYYVIRHKLTNCVVDLDMGLGDFSTSNQEHSQKLDKKLAKGHSNYDYDEIVRHSNLSDAAYGIDAIFCTDEELKPDDVCNEDEDEDEADDHYVSRYDQEDREWWKRCQEGMELTRNKKVFLEIMSLIEHQNFDREIRGKLLKWKNERN